MYMKSGKQVELGSSRAWTSQVDGFAEWNFLPRRFNLIVSKVICLSRNNSIVMNSIWDLFVGSLRWYLIWLASEWKNTFLNKSFNCALKKSSKKTFPSEKKRLATRPLIKLIDFSARCMSEEWMVKAENPIDETFKTLRMKAKKNPFTIVNAQTDSVKSENAGTPKYVRQ